MNADARRRLDRLWERVARSRRADIDAGVEEFADAASDEVGLLLAWREALRDYEFGAFVPRAAEAERRALAAGDGETAARAAEVRATALAIDRLRGRTAPGRVDEEVAILKEAIERARAWPRPEPAVRLTRKLGQVLEKVDPAAAGACFAEAREMARRAGLPGLEADALLPLAEAEFPAALAEGLGRPGFDWRFPLFEEAFRLAEAAGDRVRAATARLRLGRCLGHAGLDGRAHAREALALFEEAGDLLGQHEALVELHFGDRMQGDLLAARRDSERLDELAGRLRDPLLDASAVTRRIDGAFVAGDVDRAVAHLDRPGGVLPAADALGELIGLNVAGKELTRSADLPPDARSTEFLIRANRAVGRWDWGEALRLADEGAAFDLGRGHWWEAMAKRLLAVMAVLMGRRRPDGGFPEEAVRESRARLAQALAEVGKVNDGNQFQAVAEAHDQARNVCQLTGDHARALAHGASVIRLYRTLGRRMQLAFATAQVGLVYYSMAPTQPALYEAAIERYEEALAYFRQEDVRAQVWQLSGLLAQALFRSPVAAAPQPGDPPRGIGAALAVLEQAYSGYNQVRRRFVPAEAERPTASGLPQPDVTQSLCVLLSVQGGDAEAAWRWAERFKGRAQLDDLARTPLAAPAGLSAEELAEEGELLRALNGPGPLGAKVAAADRLAVLYAGWAERGVAEEYRSLRQGEPTAWGEIRGLLDSDYTFAVPEPPLRC